MDSCGLRVVLERAMRARGERAHIVLMGASPQVEKLIDLTGTRGHLELLETQHSNGWTPFDNAVNHRVLEARVMAVSDTELWLQATDNMLGVIAANPA